MLMLAIEQSSATGSLALFRDESLLVERSWMDTRLHSQQFFGIIPSAMKEASVSPADIALIGVGVGPGSFAGLRMAVSAARAFALPGKTRVFGLNSGAVVAAQIMRATGARTVAVLAMPAVNESGWAFLRNSTASYHPCKKAIPWPGLKNWSARLPHGVVVASPDWQRLGPSLKALCPPHATLIEKDEIPTAKVLGELIIACVERGIASEPLAPIYIASARRRLIRPRIQNYDLRARLATF